jgi:hypothetical protein
MARFARDILARMNVLTKELEVKLGPDTGEKQGLPENMHVFPGIETAYLTMFQTCRRPSVARRNAQRSGNSKHQLTIYSTYHVGSKGTKNSKLTFDAKSCLNRVEFCVGKGHAFNCKCVLRGCLVAIHLLKVYN